MAIATVSYRAELKDLREQLKNIEGINAATARKLTSDLTKSMRDVERAYGKATKAAMGNAKAATTNAKAMGGVRRHNKQASLAIQSVAVQLPDVAQQMTAGVPPMTIFVQQGLQVVQVNMRLLTTAAKAAAAALAGPWGIAIGAAVAGAVILANAIHEDRVESEAFRESLDGSYQKLVLTEEQLAATSRQWARLNDIVQRSTDLLAVESGSLSAIEVQRRKAIDDIREAAKAKLLQTAAGWAFLEVQRQTLLAAMFAADASSKERFAARKRLDEIYAELPAAKAKIDAIRDEINARIEVTGANYDEVAAIRARTEADKGAAKAVRERASAAREAERATAALAAITAASQIAVFEGQARISEEFRRQIAIIDELEAVSGDHAAAEIARASVQRAATQEIAAFRQAQAEQLQGEELARIKELQTAETTRLRERVQLEQAVYSAISGLGRTTAGALQGYASEVAESNLQAARRAFAAYKAVSIVEAAISGFAGVARALKDYPYPASLVVGGLVGAEAALQVGLIAAQTPSFADTPGPIRAGATGLSATFAPGDIVVAGREESDVRRQLDPAGPMIIQRDVYRHLGRYGARDAMRSPGAHEQIRRQARRTIGRR